MKFRKTRITVQTDEIVIIQRRRVVRFWCGECRGDSEFVRVEEINGLLEEGIGYRPGSGLHFGKAQDGSILVCVKSLTGTL